MKGSRGEGIEGKRRTGRKEGGLLCSVPTGSLFQQAKAPNEWEGQLSPSTRPAWHSFPEVPHPGQGKMQLSNQSLSVEEGPWARAGAGAGLAHNFNPDVCLLYSTPQCSLSRTASGFMLQHQTRMEVTAGVSSGSL